MLLPLLLLIACADTLCGVGQGALPLDADLLYQHDVVTDIRLHSDELAGLAEAAGEDLPDIHADLTFGGDTFDVGLKLKGSTSFRSIDEKASMKIDLGEWVEGQTLHGVRRLTLNNMVQDPAQLSEGLAYTLMEAAGVVAPRHGYACVALNGEPMGLYSVVETMDEQLVDRALGGEGTLWEARERSDFVRETYGRFELEEGEAADLMIMARFIDDLDAAAADTLLDVLDAWTDRDALLSLWAVEAIVGNYDGYSSYAHNYLVHYAPTGGRFSLIPWGVDQAFSRELDPMDPGGLERQGRLFSDCMVSAPCTAAYTERLLEVADLMESIDLAGQADDWRRWLRHSGRIDERSETGALSTRHARRRVERYIRSQPDRIREVVR